MLTCLSRSARVEVSAARIPQEFCGLLDNLRDMNGSDSSPAETRPLTALSPAIAMWAVAVDAMPMPALLIASDGDVLYENTALDPPIGSSLDTAEAANGLLIGADGRRWRLSDVGGTSAVRLATLEAEDVRDHMLRQFFAADGVLFVVSDRHGLVLVC